MPRGCTSPKYMTHPTHPHQTNPVVHVVDHLPKPRFLRRLDLRSKQTKYGKSDVQKSNLFFKLRQVCPSRSSNSVDRTFRFPHLTLRVLHTPQAMSSSSNRKRPDAGLDTSNIIDGPRKRARESNAAAVNRDQSNSKSPSPPPTTPAPKKLTLKLKKQGTGASSMVAGSAEAKDPVVFEQGMRLWNLVRNAQDSE